MKIVHLFLLKKCLKMNNMAKTKPSKRPTPFVPKGGVKPISRGGGRYGKGGKLK